MAGRRTATRELVLLCVLSTCAAEEGLGQRLPNEVASLADAPSTVWAGETPGVRASLACATGWNTTRPLGESAAELFPARDDLAWEGLAAGVGFGLIIGLGLNAAYAEEGGGRSVGDFLVTLFLPVAVTGPLGLMIGSAVPKGSSPDGSPDSVSLEGLSIRSTNSLRRLTIRGYGPIISRCVPSASSVLAPGRARTLSTDQDASPAEHLER